MLPLRLTLAVLFLFLTACEASVDPKDVKPTINPHPTLRYQITLRIENAPGPFEEINAVVSYEVTDKRCSPEDKFAGVYYPPSDQYVPLQLRPTGNDTYTGYVHRDLFESDDYFGLGTCDWDVGDITATLRSNNTLRAYLFRSSMDGEGFENNYFTKHDFFDKSNSKFVMSSRSKSSFREDYLDELFNVLMSGKEMPQ